MLRRARATWASGDAGVTLTELIVAMTLSVILGSMTLTLFIHVSNASAGTTDRTLNAASARNAIQAWTAYLRVTDGPTPGAALNRFEWIRPGGTDPTKPGDIMFHANLYNRATSGAGLATTTGSTMVWLRMDSKGALVEEQFPNSAAINAVPTVCRILVAKASATALFTPFDKGSPPSPMTGQNLGTAPAASAGCQKLPVTVPSHTSKPDPVATANLQNVSTIVIDFIVADRKNSHSFEYTSQATLPLLGGSL